MSVVRLSNAPADGNVAAEVCVVGAGIAGLLLAVRLARQKKKVVVLESGSFAVEPAIQALNEIDDPIGRYRRALDGRYRGLGGSSTRWGGRMIPINMPDTDARPHVGAPAWPVSRQSLDRYEQELETLFAIGHEPYAGDGQPALARDLPDDEENIVVRWAKCPSFKNSNVATLLRSEFAARDNLSIYLEATACGFELDRERGRLRAITARGFGERTIRVQADEFVIAAGAIESTRLLLLLDASSDGRAFAGCQVLGRYFQDHLKAEVATIDRKDAETTNRLFGYRFVKSVRRDLHLDLSRTAQRLDGVSSAFAYVAMDLGSSALEAVKQVARGIQRRQLDMRKVYGATRDLPLVARAAYWRLVRNQLFVPPDIDFRVTVCAEQLPDPSNRIRLSPHRDRLGMPQVLLEWHPTESEERTFRSAIDHLGRYWRASGLEAACPLHWRSRETERPVIEDAEACAHPSGSTRMGTDPAESVVEPGLHCHAVPNVAVVSASVFPTAGSANPTFTIMKLALRLADSYLQAVPAGQPRGEAELA